MANSLSDLILRKTSRYLGVLGLLFMLTFSMQAQDNFLVSGKFKVEKGSINGARIVVFKDGQEVKTNRPKGGRFVFELDFNAEYIISYEKSGYVTKKISINTNVPSSRVSDGFEPFEYQVILSQVDEDENAYVFDKPVGRIHFNAELDEFDYDTDYSKSIQEELEKAREEVAQREPEERSKESKPTRKVSAPSSRPKVAAASPKQEKATRTKPAIAAKSERPKRSTVATADTRKRRPASAAVQQERTTSRSNSDEPRSFTKSWVSSMAEKYPDARKEEYYEQDGRKITKITMNVNGEVNVYRQVVHPRYTYWFRNDVVVSQYQYEMGTKLTSSK